MSKQILRRQNHDLTQVQYFRFFYRSADSYERASGFGIEVLPYEGPEIRYEQWESDRNMAQQLDEEEADNLFDEILLKNKGGAYNYFLEKV